MTKKMANLRKQLEDIQKDLATKSGLEQNQRGDGVERDALGDMIKRDISVREELDRLLDEEEVFWAQRAKQRWLALGNRNTRYFHKAATIRNCRNRIICLKNEEVVFISDPHEIKSLFLRHFHNLFGGAVGGSGDAHNQGWGSD